MNEQQFKEGLAPLLNILQIFVASKKDDGKSFIDALNTIRKDENSIGKFNDLYERYGGSEEGSKPIVNIRRRLIDKLIKDGSISISDLERFKDEEKKKYNHDIFNSRTNFGILHSIYYFYDGNKKCVLDFLGQLSKSILEDVGLDVKHREQAFDYNNHFGVDDFYIGFFNKTHDTWKTAIQFRVQSKGNNKLIVGLFKNRNFIKGKYNEYSLETVSYEDLINECNKYKEDVINDKMVNLIEYIKENIDHYSDIKEKAEQERKAFIDKFPLEKIKDLSLEEYNTGMGNANKGTFTWYLNTDFAISGRLFSNGQNWLFYKGEDGKYTYAKNMKDYLVRGNGDYNSAFQVYKDDLYNFVKNFDVNTYDPEAFLSGAKYIKAALILMYKGDIFLTLGLVEVCVSIVKHLNLMPGSSINPRKADIIEYDLLITSYLKKEIPDIINKYGYSALGKCVYDYYTNYLYDKEEKTVKNTQEFNVNYYAIGADLGFGDKKEEFFRQGKLIIGWFELGDLRQFENEEALLQRYKECKFHDAESHFKQTFDSFKKIKKGDIVCVKSVYLQKKKMYIYAVGEVLEGYDNGYEYLDGLGHSLPVNWKIIDPRYEVDGAKYQKTLTKINDEEMKRLLDKLLGNTSSTDNSLHSNLSTMIDLNTILYGVPGTGKTYNTINYAVAIIENKSIEEIQKEDRKSLKQRYEKYVNEGQIVFTTFHQSFGYEDFVEGIKADVNENEGTVKYIIEPGIFKKVCNSALKGENLIVDNFEDSWNLLIDKLNENDYIDVPLISDSKRTFKIELNEYGTGLANRTYENDKFEKGEWIQGKSKFFSKEQLYNIYKGLPGVPAGGHDNYRKAIVNEMKKNYSLNEYKENLFSNNKKNYVFIIDEINRGNISKIFGELITLLEPDKRIGGKEELKVKLPYSNKEFGVPNNLYILGTMNTADRSIALIDLALRRRFKFREIKPNSELLKDIPLISGINVKELFESLNKKIEFLYDRDHLLGHAYFLPLKDEPTLDKLNSIMYDSIIPLLEEYFHDDREKIQLILGGGIINSESISPQDLGFTGTDYEEQIKYTINDNISSQDYQY